jgi:hypothetical protein
VLEKITFAGTVSQSFAQASTLLQKLSDLPTAEKQAERVTQRMGTERVAERAAEVAAYQALPLVEKFAVPVGVSAPELAVVMVDGGRMQILDRRPQAATAVAPPGVSAATVDDWEESSKKGHWREDKVGLLLTMQSTVSETDPCPEIPESFVDVLRIPRLIRELKKNVKQTEEAAGESDEPEMAEEVLREASVYEPPQVVQRKVVATRDTWQSFAPQVAATARQLGFMGAARGAFVGDGAANNWTLQRRFFGSFVPILDFIHALSYVFAAAQAGRKFQAGWSCYAQWIRWTWQGQVRQVLLALEERQRELGMPCADDLETSPRKVVQRALNYLRHHQDKMRYDAYRRQGLPITSSLMESTVKQLNQRVKGTEKFWSEDGGEAILQLRADHLSDDQPLDAFWQRRQNAATGQRAYRRVV